MSKPSTEEILAELKAASNLTEEELKTAGLDCLHFMWSVYSTGGRMLYTHKRSPRPVPLDFVVLGLVEPGLVEPK